LEIHLLFYEKIMAGALATCLIKRTLDILRYANAAPSGGKIETIIFAVVIVVNRRMNFPSYSFLNFYSNLWKRGVVRNFPVVGRCRGHYLQWVNLSSFITRSRASAAYTPFGARRKYLLISDLRALLLPHAWINSFWIWNFNVRSPRNARGAVRFAYSFGLLRFWVASHLEPMSVFFKACRKSQEA
jgi:hypothetical protein